MLEEGRFVSFDIVGGKPHATVIVDRKWWQPWKPARYTRLFPVHPIMAEVVDFALERRKQAEIKAVSTMRKSRQSYSAEA